MKVRVTQNQIANQIANLVKVNDPKSNNPIHNAIGMEIKDNQFILGALNKTDNIKTIITNVEILENSNNRIYIDSKILNKIVKVFNKDNILEFSTNEDNKLYIKYDINNGEFRLNVIEDTYYTIDGDNEPILNEFELNKTKFINAINNIKVSVSKNKDENLFDSVFFKINNNTQIIVSTDGKRLTEVKYNNSIENLNGEPIEFTLSLKSLNTFISIIKNTKDKNIIIRNTENLVILENENNITTINKKDYKFPNYTTAMRNKSSNILNVDRQELIKAIKAVNIINEGELSYIVKIKLDSNNLSIENTNKDDTAKVNIKNYTYNNESTIFGLNHKLLLPLLSNIKSKTITFEIEKHYHPICILDDNDSSIKILIMPINIEYL